MRYAIIHTVRGEGCRLAHAETPVKALHCARWTLGPEVPWKSA